MNAGNAKCRSRPVAIGLSLAAMVAVSLPSQASAASSPVVRIPAACTIEVSAPAGGDALVAARQVRPSHLNPKLEKFCQDLAKLGVEANAQAAKHYKAATRRRIRRLIGTQARRIIATQNVMAPAGLSALSPQDVFLGIGDLKSFAKGAFKVLKKTVKGVIRFIPQAKVLTCAVLGSLGAATAYIRGNDLKDVLISAGSACIMGVIGTYLPD